MISKRFNLTFACLLAAWAFAVPAQALAQIGPDLIPPGLDENHPIDSYSANGRKKVSDDWRYQASWELNAADVVFSAAKKRQLISEAPSTIHVITDRDINAHGWRSLAEILRHVPGVQTQTTHSQFQSVMIRGLVGTENNNSRILWLQNGVPMNDVRDSGIWLDETYPVEMIKRIEVVLGPGSALYGSGAFQGVVNIFTKDPSDINKYGEYRITMQNNLTFKASAIAAYNSETSDFGILAHVAGSTTQGPQLIGDYQYEDYSMIQGGANVGAGLTVNDYYYDRISSNSDKHWYNINFKLHYEDLKWNVGFTDIYAKADGTQYRPYVSTSMSDINDTVTAGDLSEIDGKEAPSLSPYHFNRREFYTDLIYETSFTDDLSFLAVASYRLNQYRFENYAGFSDTNGTGNTLNITDEKGTLFTYKYDFAPIQHKLYLLAQAQWRIYSANELIGGIALEYHNINSDHEFAARDEQTIEKDASENQASEKTYNTTHNRYDYVTPSIFLQDEQRFWDDRIILTLGARLDMYKISRMNDVDDKSDLAPSWRAAFLGKWTDWMTMRLSYGYAFKEPSLYQLYADSLDYHGNDKLTNEDVHNVELSFLFTPTYFMKIRFDAFASFISNLITVSFDSESQNYKVYGIDGRYTPTQNYGANIYGFELAFDSAIGKNWNIYAHYNFLYSEYTNTDTKNTDTETATATKTIKDKRIPDDAMHRFKIGATFQNEWITADLSAFLVGGSPETTSVFPNVSGKTGTDSNDPEKYAVPFYAIVQPQITAHLGANIGAMVQGTYTFSENMTKSPTHKFYFEKEGVPVPRYSVMFSLIYPFRNTAN